MIKLNDIKQQNEELKKSFKEFQAYANQVEELEKEVAGLEALGESKLSVTQAIHLAKAKENLVVKDEAKNKAILNIYPVLYGASYDLAELIKKYIVQEMENDNELKTLKQEYLKTKEKMLHLAVEHDTKYSDKLDKMKKAISDIGCITLLEEIKDYKDAKKLDLHYLSTEQVKYFNPEQFKIEFPDGMYHEYEDAMKQYKAKKTLPWFGKK